MNSTTTTSKTHSNYGLSVERQKYGLILLALLLFSSFLHAQVPELFKPDVVSTRFKERDMTISPKGDHLLYSIHSHNNDQRMIVEMKLTNEGWSQPTLVSFSGKYKDLEPMFDPRGDRLFFASDRPMSFDESPGDYNIWYVQYSASGWGEPMALDTLINTSGDEFYPSVSNNGTIYFTATRADGVGKEDIFYSKWDNDTYQKPVPMDTAVNSATYEFNSFVDPDERYLIFSSYGRSDGFGGGDLYIAYQIDGRWTSAINLGDQINSKFLDYCPFVSADQKTFYFTSNRADQSMAKNVAELRLKMDKAQNGFDDIYTLPMSILPENP